MASRTSRARAGDRDRAELAAARAAGARRRQRAAPRGARARPRGRAAPLATPRPAVRGHAGCREACTRVAVREVRASPKLLRPARITHLERDSRLLRRTAAVQSVQDA